jgi:hypothetical protein
MSGFPSRKDMDQNHSDSNPICEGAGRSSSWLDSGPGIFHIENFTFTTWFDNIYSVIYLKKNYEKQYSLHTFKTIEQNTSHSTKRKQKI